MLQLNTRFLILATIAALLLIAGCKRPEENKVHAVELRSEKKKKKVNDSNCTNNLPCVVRFAPNDQVYFGDTLTDTATLKKLVQQAKKREKGDQITVFCAFSPEMEYSEFTEALSFLKRQGANVALVEQAPGQGRN